MIVIHVNTCYTLILDLNEISGIIILLIKCIIGNKSNKFNIVAFFIFSAFFIYIFKV